MLLATALPDTKVTGPSATVVETTICSGLAGASVSSGVIEAFVPRIVGVNVGSTDATVSEFDGELIVRTAVGTLEG